LGKGFDASHFFEVNQGFNGFALTEEVAKLKLFAVGLGLTMGAVKLVVEKLNRRVTCSNVEGFAPLAHGSAQIAD